MKTFLTVISFIVAVPLVVFFIMGLGLAGRKIIGEDPDQMDKPSHWLTTFALGIIGVLLFGYIMGRSGCSEREAEYQMENSRDPGY